MAKDKPPKGKKKKKEKKLELEKHPVEDLPVDELDTLDVKGGKGADHRGVSPPYAPVGPVP